MSESMNFRISRALRQVRNVFRDKSRWIRGQYHSHANNPEIERFCVRGALMQATAGEYDQSSLFLTDPDLRYDEAKPVLEATSKRLHDGKDSMEVNDSLDAGLGYDAIMHVLDTAISDLDHEEQTTKITQEIE